MRANQWRN